MGLSVRPVFRIEAAGRDVTRRIADRLIALQVTLTSDNQGDALSLTLDNRDAALPTLPARTPLRVWLGYETPDFYMGEYLRTEATHDLVPRRPLDPRHGHRFYRHAEDPAHAQLGGCDAGGIGAPDRG